MFQSKFMQKLKDEVKNMKDIKGNVLSEGDTYTVISVQLIVTLM